MPSRSVDLYRSVISIGRWLALEARGCRIVPYHSDQFRVLIYESWDSRRAVNSVSMTAWFDSYQGPPNSNPHLAQLGEAAGSNPAQSEFESQGGDQKKYTQIALLAIK